MKIRSQIIFAQLPTAILMVLITFFFVFSLTAIQYKSESILTDNFKKIISMQKLNDSLEDLNNYIVRKAQGFDETLKKMEIKISQEIVVQEKTIRGPGEEENLIKKLRTAWEAYRESIRSFAPSETIEKNYEELRHLTNNILSLNQDSIIRKKDDLSNFIFDYRLILSVYVIFSLVFGFSMSWIFTGLILTPLNKMTELVSQFGKTDQTTLLHIKGSEEIEKLSEEFNLMTNRLEEYHQSSLGRAIEDYENLKAAFDAPPYPVLIFSHSNEIIYMNKMALKLFRVVTNINENNYKIYYIESALRDTLLKVVTNVQSVQKPYPTDKIEEPITVFKQKEKYLFSPFAYPIKNKKESRDPQTTSVLMVLQDVRLQSASEQETEQIFRTFIQGLQVPIAEIQMAIYTSLQEEVGPLTEKQKDILYAVRDQSEKLEALYQDFLKMSGGQL